MKAEKKIEKKSKHVFGMTDADFSKENFIEGGVIRPLILMSAFFSFIIAMFLLLLGAKDMDLNMLKWGGSLIIFSFVLNLYSIYESLKDKPSIFKNMNLGFKFTLFLIEVVAFNWILATILN
ncbi:MAG: hypothetical protein PF569_07680 [Candidatus Woesearchaeota archaeon]|jgi:hypothetical protein|nr:hypothetical protein [Candidatus Woesearchaeota archaeon]